MTKEDRKAIAEHCDRMAKACDEKDWAAVKKSYETLGKCFGKSASDDGDASAKTVTAAVDGLRADFNKKLEEFGKTLIPTQVRGVLPTGLELIGRAGGPTPQSDATPEATEILGPM